jgi:F420-dependent methylenetetrahydromethanopterin dehydrogenase
MSRQLLTLYAVTIMFALGTNTAAAQESSYDERALRIDEHMGTLRLVRGTSETVVAKIGTFRGGNVAEAVSLSPKAVAEAKVFQDNYRPGSWMAAIGIATLGAAIGAARISDLNQAVPISLAVVSVSLIAVGGLKLDTAYRALARAVWWYNRDLK